MSSEPERQWRDVLPKVNFFDKSVELIASFDRLMVTIYSGLIAGSVVLLLKEEVSLWVGAPLVLALGCFVIGIGHTLIHIGFMSKMLLLAEALANGTQIVPNAVEEDEQTAQAYARNQAYAQRSYASQIVYLLVGIGFGAVAVIVRLWEYAWRAGVLLLAGAVVLFAIVALIVTWKKTLRRFRPSLTAQRKA